MLHDEIDPCAPPHPIWDMIPRKKYEIVIWKGECWDAQLVCYCGQNPETMAVVSTDLPHLLTAITRALLAHEMPRVPLDDAAGVAVLDKP